MKTICFFNFYHNGDCFISREYIKHLGKQLPGVELIFCHNNNRKLLSDLNIQQYPIQSWMQQFGNNKFAQSNDTFFINTWVGAYLEGTCTDSQHIIKKIEKGVDLNYSSFYRIWQYIFDVLNSKFNLTLNLHPNVEDYFFDIDYTKYPIKFVDEFVAANKDKKLVLVCNGGGNSSQSNYNDDMSWFFNDVSKLYENTIFIFTKKFKSDCKNITFTDDVIMDLQGCDLNEISYLSKYCDVVIGRNSGPFHITNTKENYDDENKTFLCLSKNYYECFPADLKIKANYIFKEDINKEVITQSIMGVLK